MKEIKTRKFLLSPNDVSSAIVDYILKNSDLTRDEIHRSQVSYAQSVPAVSAEVSPLDEEDCN